MKSNSENLEYGREKFELKEENDRLQKENDRADCLLGYYIEERSGVVSMCEQRNRACGCTKTNSNCDPPKWEPWR
jgi:hypothetical protein